MSDKKEMEAAVGDCLEYVCTNYPDLPAPDAMGVLIVAGVRVGQVAGLDHHAANVLREIADQLDQRQEARTVN